MLVNIHTSFRKDRLAPFALILAAAGTAASFSTDAGAQPQLRPEPIDADVAEAINVTDAEAALRIQERLYEELPVSDLIARVRDGVATLEGTVKTDEDRLQAAAIARRVEGVGGVINQLEVDATAIDDVPLGNSGATLETAVAAELGRDPVLNFRDIRVVADQRTNTVTLIGEVASETERQRATRVAEDAFAVGHVRNRLQVRQDP